MENIKNTLNISVEPSAIISKFNGEILNIGKKLSEIVKKIELPKIQIDEKITLNIGYLMLMHKLQFPLFLENDEDFKRTLVDAELNKEDVLDLINNSIDDNYINTVYIGWEKSICINNKRLPILKEAVDLHKSGYYYASTTIMMCQLAGIISDIDNFCVSSNIVLSDKDKQNIADEYNLKKMDNEKGKIIQIAHINDYGSLLQEVIATYFKDIIFSYSDLESEWEQNPLRHKICHGMQLNYGTKNHSLKALLSVGLLYNIANNLELLLDK